MMGYLHFDQDMFAQALEFEFYSKALMTIKKGLQINLVCRKMPRVILQAPPYYNCHGGPIQCLMTLFSGTNAGSTA